MITIDREALIAGIESWLDAKLPAQYSHFLISHEDSIIGDRVFIYPAENVVERNETFEARIYCPGYIVIGDDSGGNAFVIPLDQEPCAVYVIDQGSMDPDYFELVSSDLSEWIIDGCPII